jgi:hypothetical protein
MNVNDLTLGQIKEISALFNMPAVSTPLPVVSATAEGLNSMIGKRVIVRTYSAGVWFGTLTEKSGNEVIITNARRMWKWHAAESISLSAVAIHGIKQSNSKICEAVDYVWLEAVELIPCSAVAVNSIEGAPIVKAE